MAEDTKTYECPDCGEVFDKPIDLARHKKAEHPQPKTKEGRGPRAESLLNEEDRSQLREEELELKRLEMQVRRAKLESELNRYKGTSEPPRLRKWSLPDGTVIEGSAQDYKDLLEIYYMQNQKKSAPVEDSTTIKALLDRIAELEKITTESKLRELNDKLSYLASRDPLEQANDALQKFHKMAQEQGLIRAGTSVADEVRLKHADVQTQTLLTAVNSLSKKIDRSMERASKIESQAMPILSKIGDLYVQDFAARRRAQLGEPEPISEREIALITKNLEKNNIQQEVGNMPSEHLEQKPEPPKSEPPKMKEYKFTGINPLPGYDLSQEGTENATD